MSLKQAVKHLLPPIIVDAGKQIKNHVILRRYLHKGIPWSAGYNIYKWQLITQALADRSLLERFRLGEQLPPAYGIGVDERCIEYPWLLARLHNGPEVFLDAGSTLNHPFILDHPVFRSKVIHTLTLAPEANCFWQRGTSYLFHDLRDIPTRDAYYDTIACLSTLEHVGCNNTGFTPNQTHNEHRAGDFVLVMQEFRRVLKSGGTLLLTVPFGVYQHFGTFQQFNRELLCRAVEAFGKASDVSETFYRYAAGGWNLADAANCAECDYVTWVAALWLRDEWPNHVSAERDRAAAARAVACVRLTKN
jgi:SAM-dependent methyltransferase